VPEADPVRLGERVVVRFVIFVILVNLEMLVRCMYDWFCDSCRSMIVFFYKTCVILVVNLCCDCCGTNL
jgi:hypothetical protein